MLMVTVVNYLCQGYIVSCEGRGKATLDVKGPVMAWWASTARVVAYYFVNESYCL